MNITIIDLSLQQSLFIISLIFQFFNKTTNPKLITKTQFFNNKNITLIVKSKTIKF